MPIWKNYHVAQDVSDAIQALTSAQGSTGVIAGGTDLLLDLQQGRHKPFDLLVDITQIPEMRLIEIRQERLFIGAGLPLNQVVASPLVYEHARTLFESAGLIGGPQVRNIATLGGNVAHALPAADGTISLMALDAQAEVAGPDGRRLLPIGEMFLGPGKSALDPHCQVLVGFHLPLRRPGQASAFRRIMRPQGVAIAILNMSIWLELSAEYIADIRIAIGPAGPTPLRARRAEDALRGATLEAPAIEGAAEALLAEARFRDSPHRATAAYRRRMARVLLDDVLHIAWQRAVTD